MKTLLTLFLGCSFSLFGQLEIYPTSPTYIESGDLFGPDYQIYNAQYFGSPYAYAQFNGVNSNLGLTRGFVLTTGEVANFQQGILGPNNSSEAGVDLPSYTEHIHPFLGSQYTGGNAGDGAYLTFKFVPSVDSLVFNYSFGSDEYLEFVGSVFADPVGVYVTGPGIDGIQNLLQIGGEDVSITTVHSDIQNAFGAFFGVNEAFFQNNDTIDSDDTKIEYDGFTINTVARLENLQIGQEYEMTIAIADAVDHLYDSGLFIEACETCVPTLGIVEEQEEWEVSPNPVSDILIIRIAGAHDYKINSVFGQEVMTGRLEAEAFVDVSGLQPGVYWISTDFGEAKRIVKQ